MACAAPGSLQWPTISPALIGSATKRLPSSASIWNSALVRPSFLAASITLTMSSADLDLLVVDRGDLLAFLQALVGGVGVRIDTP